MEEIKSIYNKVFWGRKEIVLILTTFGVTEKASIHTFQELRKDYLNLLQENNYVNPGVRGVPSEMVKAYCRRVFLFDLDKVVKEKCK